MSAACTPVSRPRLWSSPATGPKSGSTPGTPLFLQQQHLASIQGNDDKQERRQRRRSRVLDLHPGGVAAAAAADSPLHHSTTGTPVSVPRLSSAQISEHYSTCIKLSTENKITTKNAFGLHLIDYMADILKQKDSELNFKVAAGTLDASTKIYAVRVDAVHADAYRVLGGLGSDSKNREAPEPGNEEGEVGGDEEENRAASVAKQSAPKKRPAKKTVEQNLSNINLSESEMKSEVDPMFQRMASSFDENSTAGVFLSVLFSEDHRCQLQFPSHLTLLKPRPPACQGPAPTPAEGHAPASPFAASLRSLKDRTICPSLQDFSFTQWTLEQSSNLQHLLDKMKRGEHAFDVNAELEPEQDHEAPDYGDHFDADDDDDDNCAEALDERKDAFGRRSPDKGRSGVVIGKADISTMCLQLSDRPREYSYFSPRTMATWVGPGYWLFKPAHKHDHKPEKEVKKRAPKSPLVIDFKQDMNFHNYFRTTRAATTIKSALNSSKKTTLPADFQYPPSSLSQLGLKPANTLSAAGKKRLSGELGGEIGEYDYDNANDTANFCPGLQAGDDDDDDNNEGFGSPDDSQPATERLNQPDNVSTYGEDCLVPEPHKINIIEINYAKTAKKMNMKRLKSSMWSLLTDTPEKNALQPEPETCPEVAGEKSFSQSAKSLLKRLPAAMANDLSVPLAFVALLHLANEKNLELHKVDDMSDIIIKQGQ